MSIKSILCAYSGEEAKGNGLRHAIRIAQHHDAFLTGVVRHGRSYLHRQFSAQLPASVLEQLEEQERDRIADIAARFAHVVGAAGHGESAQFVDLDPEVDGPLAEFSRAFDLVVTGNHSSARHEDHLSAHPDLIALRSGRPVLVVPDGYQADALADHAIVAWDGKRASTRALVAAMPVLEEKAKVTLLTVGETPRNTDRLLDTISRHGILATALSVPKRGSVAATLLTEGERLGAKLIVIGAFEHSKFSHDVVGGVTTDILRKASVPVLMAH